MTNTEKTELIDKKDEIYYEVYVDGHLWAIYNSYEEANDVCVEMGDTHECYINSNRT